MVGVAGCAVEGGVDFSDEGKDFHSNQKGSVGWGLSLALCVCVISNSGHL